MAYTQAPLATPLFAAVLQQAWADNRQNSHSSTVIAATLSLNPQCVCSLSNLALLPVQNLLHFRLQTLCLVGQQLNSNNLLDNWTTHTVDSGSCWRRFYLDSETTMQSELCLTAMARNNLTYLLTIKVTLLQCRQMCRSERDLYKQRQEVSVQRRRCCDFVLQPVSNTTKSTCAHWYLSTSNSRSSSKHPVTSQQQLSIYFQHM